MEELFTKILLKNKGWNEIDDNEANVIISLFEEYSKLKLYKKFAQFIGPHMRDFGDNNLGFTSKNPEGRYIVYFPPFSPDSIPDEELYQPLSNLRALPTVSWANLSTYEGSSCVAACTDVEFLGCTQPIIKAWRESPLRSRQLILLDEESPDTPLPPKFTLSDKKKALLWWQQNNAEAAKLFDAHSELEAVFLDYPLRKGKFDTNNISLVLVVRQKFFIPEKESALPSLFHGLPTDVRSSHVELCGPAHLDAINHSETHPYIGVSIGTPDSTRVHPEAGTLGLVLNSPEIQYGLTAHHVLTHSNKRTPKTREITTTPAIGDQPNIKHNIGELTYCYGTYGENEIDNNFPVTLDIALLESSSGLLPRTTTLELENPDINVFWQDKEVSLEETENVDYKLAFFGRSSGAQGLQTAQETIEFYQAGISHIKLPNALDLQKAPRTNITLDQVFLNQILFWGNKRDIVDHGDSGAGLFLVRENKIHPVGLVIARSTAKYGIATPVTAILQHLRKKGYNVNVMKT